MSRHHEANVHSRYHTPFSLPYNQASKISQSILIQKSNSQDDWNQSTIPLRRRGKRKQHMDKNKDSGAKLSTKVGNLAPTDLLLLFFSRPVVSNSLPPHGLQHTRPPRPSPSPGACSNSHPWVGDAIQLPHPLSSPSPPAFNLSQHQCLFQWISSSHQVVKV